MKWLILSCYCFFLFHTVGAQEEAETGQALEDLAASEDETMIDDSFLEQFEKYKSDPLLINEATEEELALSGFLSALQIKNLIRYRLLLGLITDVYELQAIPGWDIPTIKRILPYISISQPHTILSIWKERWVKGAHRLIIRTGFSPKDGLESTSSRYSGSGLKFLMKYRYDYKQLLSWAITGEKDAGESFLKGKQKSGFDFYSFHIFLKKFGKIESLAIGDFSVNMGQGLIQWQSLAFKKSATVMNIKRQSAVLRPYASSGEYNFYRGVGVSITRGRWSGSFFLSNHKITTTLNTDSLSEGRYISSIDVSGYHRSTTEADKKNNARLAATGLVVKYVSGSWHLALNAVLHHYSYPLVPTDEVYKLYAGRGKSFLNCSVDYSYTCKNFHFFGETAVNKTFHFASINGVLIALDRKMDLTFLYRKISAAYQAISGNAFTENALPFNEEGLYTGLFLRPSSVINVQAYADIFHFPWLKYRVNAPSNGYDYLLEIQYNPSKLVTLHGRIRTKSKALNNAFFGSPMMVLFPALKTNLRFHASIQINKEVNMENRCEMVWVKTGENKGQGFLMYTGLEFRPALKHWAVHSRLTFFQTEDYETRIYAYETIMPMSFSIPAFYGTASRLAVSFQYQLTSTQIRLLGKWRLQLALQGASMFYSESKNYSPQNLSGNMQLVVNK